MGTRKLFQTLTVFVEFSAVAMELYVGLMPMTIGTHPSLIA